MCLAASLTVLLASPTQAQPFEGVGARAQGMGAFVAVADDASAVYWNPAGLAAGAYFSLIFDRTEAEAVPDDRRRGARRSSWLVALSMPAAGLSYYRLRWAAFAPAPPGESGRARVESLVTHHAGATLVQSLGDRIAVGATLKMVRGVANADVTGYGGSGADAAALLDELPLGRAGSRFDADAGLMVEFGVARAGLTVRNLFEPEFETPGEEPLRLDRQARAGLALRVTGRWIAAVDVDLTSNRGPVGDLRALAIGAEGPVTRRLIARGGLHINTSSGAARTPGVTLGASYAVLASMLVDAQIRTGSEPEGTGWGIAGRVAF